MRENDHVDGELTSSDGGSLTNSEGGVKLQLENVWFRYPTRDVPILNGLDMTVSRDTIQVSSPQMI
jgi:ABC-type bacteriocin/lantibiotic exporter with double-glycine peptidase domain